jgi:hypothetical protein
VSALKQDPVPAWMCRGARRSYAAAKGKSGRETVMATIHTADRGTSGRATRGVAYLAAAAFAVASAWYALISAHVTVAAPPSAPAPGEPVDVAMHRWYAWVVTTLPQERAVAVIAVVGMLGLAAVASSAGARPGRLSGRVVGVGAVLWVVGEVVLIGGHRAVGLMATHANPIETVNAINFTVDLTNEAFEVAGFALMACGMAGLAAAARRGGTARGWATFTGLVAAVMLLVAGAFAADAGDLATWAQAVGGLLLLPAWLVWTVRPRPVTPDGPGDPAPGGGAALAGARHGVDAHR